jgi:hypothetical protein
MLFDSRTKVLYVAIPYAMTPMTPKTSTIPTNSVTFMGLSLLEG